MNNNKNRFTPSEESHLRAAMAKDRASDIPFADLVKKKIADQEAGGDELAQWRFANSSDAQSSQLLAIPNSSEVGRHGCF